MAKIKSLILIGLLMTAPAQAAELTLNDLPDVLDTLRQCRPRKDLLSSISSGCKLSSGDVWASVKSSGEVTIYYERGTIKAYGYGPNVNAAIRHLAEKLNSSRGDSKDALDSIAPLLPTQ